MPFEDLFDSSNYEVPIKARPSITINGMNLRIYGFELTGMPDIALPPTSQRTSNLTGRHGQLAFGDLYENWNFSVEGQIVGQNLEDVVKKQHQLLRFLDIERDQDFAIGETTYQGLRFEISGAPLFANKGAVTVTNNSKQISGYQYSTLFTAYAKQGATFEVAGDSTIYTIESVTSDDILTVTPAITRASGSNLSYRIERRRYLMVSYDGSSSITPIADRGFYRQGGVGEIVRLGYNFTFGFYTVYPYWVGDTFTRKLSPAVKNSINTLEYVGNAPCAPIYFIKGEAVNPSITAGRTAFQVTCDGQVKGTGVKNNGEITPAVTNTADGANTANIPVIRFKPIETTTSFGAYVPSSGGYRYLTYSGLNINKNRFSGFMSYQIESIITHIDLCTIVIDADNYLKVRYLGYTSDKVDIYIEQGNNQVSLTSVSSIEITTGLGYHTIGFWFDSSGVIDNKDSVTYYAKILLDGEIVFAVTSSIPSFSGDLSKVSFETSDTEGAFKDAIIFNHALSDEALREMHFADTAKNNNNTLNYNATLSADDVVRYNSRDTSSELFDSDLGAKINAYSSFSGNAPLLYGDDNERDDIFVTTSDNNNIAELNVTYQPHFR